MIFSKSVDPKRIVNENIYIFIVVSHQKDIDPLHQINKRINNNKTNKKRIDSLYQIKKGIDPLYQINKRINNNKKQTKKIDSLYQIKKG